MGIFAFALALILYAALFVGGMALCAYGGFVIWQSMTVFSNMAKAGAEAPPIGFMVQHFGLHALLIAAGLGLAFVAVRRTIRRFQLGLPGASEGVGGNPVSRLLFGAIYGAGFLFGSYSFAVSLVPGVQMALLVQAGIETKARITYYTATDDPEVWTSHYEFTTRDGQLVRDSKPTEPSSQAPSVKQMPTASLYYLPSDPSQNNFTQDFTLASFVLFMAGRLLIALVGLWGMLRNLLPPRTAAEVAANDNATPETPIPQLRTRVVAAGGPRSFGRRGS